MDQSIEIVITGNWFNGWFLRVFARPEVEVDGERHRATWGEPCRIPVTPGQHRVAAGIRYRGTRWLLGRAPIDVSVSPGSTVALRARNGSRNYDPFRIVHTDGSQP